MKWACLLLALDLGGGVRAGVVVNELQSSNGETLVDEDGDASDWIELMNTGPATVDVAGWGISDREDVPFKWVFPARLLEPGERLLVWASGKDRAEPVIPAGLAPDGIPGLVLWLDAGMETFTNGSPVAVWTDRSGKGNHALAPEPGKRPVFVSGAVNGRPVLDFDRSAGQELHLPTATFNGLVNLNDFTLISVARWRGAANSGIFGAWGATENGGSTHFEINSGGALRLRVAALDGLSAGGAVTTGTWNILTASMTSAGDSPAARLYRNNVLLGANPGSSGISLLENYGIMAVGNSHGPTNQNFDGEIAELLIYDRALGEAERAALNIYLLERYGLDPVVEPPPAPGLHTNFSISSEGEALLLTRPDGTTADLVPAALIPRDASYGRSPDGTGGFAFFAVPTPGEANTSIAYGPPAGKPVFAEQRGFREFPFSLELAHPDPAATIRYTLDGSEPGAGNGTTYNGPIQVAGNRVIRAVALLDGALPLREIETHSYLFPDQVAQVTSRPAAYPSTWNGFVHTSYAFSPTVAAQAGYAQKMRQALESLPVLSLSMSVDDFFGSGGVYSNPTSTLNLEKPVSSEWIGLPGTPDFQIDARLRVQGGASRQFNNTPKKALRLLFKNQYGEGRLRQAVLAAGGTSTDDFNTIVLRSEYNNSWLHWDAAQRLRGSFVRDQWVRDTQLAMGGAGSAGTYIHLFLNGLYWGVYNPAERPDAAFAASYFGGEREDYDAMTHDGIRDGDNIAWNQMMALAAGGLTQPEAYEAIQQFLDVDQFIDYMVLNIFGGNSDWPANNWSAVRLRQAGAGFRFHCWDAERSLEGNTVDRSNVTGSTAGNPANLYASLRQNEEFRLRFADRLHRHFFNGGALTPDRNVERYLARAASVQTSMFGEEARWGAYRKEIYDRGGPSPLYAVSPHWLNERNRLTDQYFPVRTGNVLNQFRLRNLYPAVGAPGFSQHGGLLQPPQTVGLSTAQGTIYFTLDGSDPRVSLSGNISQTAQAYTAPILLSQSATLKARSLYNGIWSALNEAAFIVEPPEPEFIPGGNGDWALDANWTSSAYPNGPASRATINAPAAGDRNINCREPVTVGRLTFNKGDSSFLDLLRDRPAGNTVNTLRFDGGQTLAALRVSGSGSGFVEFAVEAGVILTSDLELEVSHSAGSPEFGALRLRTGWSGPGGIFKSGLGVASMTGEGKAFTGPLEVREGVLRLTEPSVPTAASAVRVLPGGQLRLVSSGSPRFHGFNTPIELAGTGRGVEIPDSAGAGKLGALRYDPGTNFNHAVIGQPITLTGPASIHVDGSSNLLEMSAPLTGTHTLTKSGGGSLRFSAGSSAFSGPILIANGMLSVLGSAGPISGNGVLLLDGAPLTIPSVGGVTIAARMLGIATPIPQGGVLRTSGAPVALAGLRLYLPEDPTSARGAIFTPFEENLAAAVAATPVEIYAPDSAGSHSFGGSFWSPVSGAQTVVVPLLADFGQGAEAGKTLEVRIGAAPASFEAWLLQEFPDPADRADPDISGPLADPAGTGLANLMRYALGFPVSGTLPALVGAGGDLRLRFPYDPGRNDIVLLVESSTDLGDWGSPEIHFNSRTDFPLDLENGFLDVAVQPDGPRKFFRLRVVRNSL